MKDIGKNIKDLRSAKNMTQDELAETLFVTRQTVSNYETGKSRPDVEMLTRIAEALETDVNSLIYGPAPEEKKTEQTRLLIGAALTILFGLLYAVLHPITRRIAITTYDVGWWWGVEMIFRPAFFFFAGWSLMQILGMALKRKPLEGIWPRRAGILLLAVLIFLFLLTLWNIIATIMNDYLYANHIRGEWFASINIVTGLPDPSPGWRRLPDPAPDWVKQVVGWIAYYITDKSPWVYFLLGSLLWFLGIPKRK